MISNPTFWQWTLVIVTSVLFIIFSPLAKDKSQFFQAVIKNKAPSYLLLTGSLVISWIFAKSITNAANLGMSYGWLGSLAYAAYYLSFVFAGIIIYQLRVNGGFNSIHEFLTSKYGRKAVLLFSLLITFRLYNEIWSNTMVIGSYFGAEGSPAYIWSILVFTVLTLLYALKGGLSSSIFTDGIQLILFSILLIIIMRQIFVVESMSWQVVQESSSWSFEFGLNLLLVAVLQSLSYPFHDPVMTDRGFITAPKVMRRSFITAGIIGGVFIFIFGLIGVFVGQGNTEGQAPVIFSQQFGIIMLLVVNFIMITSAASTLDSTFSSFSKLLVLDIGWGKSLSSGRMAMIIIAVLGTLPIFLSPEILEATTISGTMVLGLTPIFLFWKKKAPKISFYGSIGSGLLMGVIHLLGIFPTQLQFTTGPYAELLWVNVFGLIFSFVFYFVPIWMIKKS